MKLRVPPIFKFIVKTSLLILCLPVLMTGALLWSMAPTDEMADWLDTHLTRLTTYVYLNDQL